MRCAGACLLIFSTLGCRNPEHPSERGAHLLPQTEGLELRSDALFSLSPSGGLVLFTRSPSAPGAREGVDDRTPDTVSYARSLVQTLARSVLYEVTGRSRSIDVDASTFGPVAEVQPEAFLGPICWTASGDTAYIAGSGPDALAVAVDEPRPAWRLVRFEEATRQRRCPEPAPRGQQLFGDHGPFVIEWVASRRSIQVRDRTSPRRILLRHRGTLLRPDVGLAEVILAPGGNRLAIVVSRGLGSFTGTPELILISRATLDSEPILLGGPVYRVHWAPDGSGIIAASTLPRGIMLAIYRWQIGPTDPP